MKKLESYNLSKAHEHVGMKWRWLSLALVILQAVFLISCSTIDCPFNNHVYTKYKLAGDVSKLTDYLTISTNKFEDSDPVLINSINDVDSFMLPMSYNRPEDVLFFSRSSASGGLTVVDTVTIKKQDTPHFESIDCNPSYFHRIEGIRYTHHGIDSIVIKNTNVTYDESKTHFEIYFKILGQ